MKKLFLLIVLMSAYCFNTMAQSTVPVPGDLDPSNLDWIDREPYQFPDGTWVFSSEFDILIWNQDVMGNFVANDYPGWQAEFDAMDNGETLEYTILDRDKISFSIYTDLNEIHVFNPAEYEEFNVPTTDIPYTIFDGPNGDASSTYPHFAWDCIHFASETNHVENIEGKEPFFQWRIGVQVHYTVDGVQTSSNIAYFETCDKPVTMLGDVNNDGEVNITDAIVLINYISNGVPTGKFNKFNADTNDDNTLNISDAIVLVNRLMNEA